jgi:hypothetical protein
MERPAAGNTDPCRQTSGINPAVKLFAKRHKLGCQDRSSGWYQPENLQSPAIQTWVACPSLII